MNLKLSKTAIRELTRLYRGVLVAAIVATAIASTGAKAADTFSGAITDTTTFMDNLHTADPSWDRDDGVITGWGVDQVLAIMTPAATKIDAAVTLVNDTTKGNEALYTALAGKQDTLTTGSITSNLLAADSVITTKIKDGAVTTNKIKDNAVTEDKLSSSLQTKITQIATNTAGIATNTANIASLTTTVASHDSTLSTLGSTVAQHTSDITNLTADMSTAKSDISTLKSDMSTAKSDISALQTSVATNTSNIAKIVDGSTTLASVTTSGDATIGGNASVAGNLAVTGSLSSDGLDAGSGTITTTGTISGATGSFSSTLSAGDTTVKSLTIGTTGYGITSTGAANVASLNAGSGKIETSGAVEAGTLAVTGTSTFAGLATLNGGFSMGGKTVTDIATAAIAAGAGDTGTLATTASVLASAENGTYSGSKVKGDSSSTTIGAALNQGISALNNILIDDGSMVNDAKVQVSWNSTDKTLEDVLGNGAFSTEHNIAKGDSMTAALSKVDAAIGNRASLGSANTALNTATTTSVAAGLKVVGDAIGDLQYTAPTSVNYTAPAANTDLTTVVAQISKNIGTAAELATAGTNGVAAAQTVNANINAVNATIGDITTLAAGTGSTGDAITNGTGTAATTVVQALNNIDATIGDIHGLQAKIQTSDPNAGKNLAAGTTVEDHLTSLDASIGNRTISSANTSINTAVATDVATGFAAVGDIIGDQNYSSTKYVSAGDDLTTAIGKLDQNIERVEGRVDAIDNRMNKMHHEMKSGFASVAAMSALVPNARVAGDTQIAVGTGYYRGTTGFALGAFHHINDNVLLNAGASYGGNGAAMFKGGVTFGF